MLLYICTAPGQRTAGITPRGQKNEDVNKAQWHGSTLPEVVSKTLLIYCTNGQRQVRICSQPNNSGLRSPKASNMARKKACLSLMQTRSVSRSQRHPPSLRGVWLIHRGGRLPLWSSSSRLSLPPFIFIFFSFALLLLLNKAVEFAFHVCIPLCLVLQFCSASCIHLYLKSTTRVAITRNRGMAIDYIEY